ncbi:MAG: hypothetical protein HYV97_08950 [Bdellovibrio sp.]|nr:hypothetical protein [Bdellovibrio sp.]
MQKIVQAGSVRVDLLGGTIDLPPIHMILQHVVTINLATTLQARVSIEEIASPAVVFESVDYAAKTEFSLSLFQDWDQVSNPFKELQFVALIVALFRPQNGLKIILESGSPPGAGLGGSSAMGITLFRALAKFYGRSFTKKEMFLQVNAVESKILNRGPAGYQDYFPALFGGILALRPVPGDILVEQFYNDDLRAFLEKRLSLIYSGETRLSGINNWEVYKKFFDGDETIRNGLREIADLSQMAYQAILKSDYDKLPSLMIKEGQTRSRLFPNILSSTMQKFESILVRDVQNAGVKVCGAGGGGCFLAIHKPEDRPKVEVLIREQKLRMLDLRVMPPSE